MHQLAVTPDLKTRLIEYLQERGYQTTEETRLRGKSGIEHVFDLVAQKDDGFIRQRMVVCIAAADDRQTEATTIFNFANKAYDVDIHDRILIAVPELSGEARQLAGKQRIKVIDWEQLKELFDSKPAQLTEPDEPIKFETKSQLAESLTRHGYRVEENAKAQGKSGVEYTFDMLAYVDTFKIDHRIGIDFLSGEKEVNLGQISLFDTKAYDVGLIHKAIVVSPGLSPEASQFAQHQEIKVFESGQKPISESTAIKGKPLPAEHKPASSEEAETPVSQRQTKTLRQTVQAEAVQLIPEVTARRYNAIPLSVVGNTLQVAMADSTDIFALEALAAQSRKRIKPIAANLREVREAIDFNYKNYGEIEKQISHINMPTEATDEDLDISTIDDTPITQALNLIIDEAVRVRSSDIHIEPAEDRVRIRYRIDGTLHDMASLPRNIRRALISRIKIMANLNIADRHHPQDGQLSVQARERDLDVRVATSPTVWGEMAVLRLLDKSMALRGLSELGLSENSLEKFNDILRVSYGMILIGGPTGAGKTTTLYAAINSLDKMGRNVITIEDPAEYRLEDINQIQVNPQAGITFASGLRSILRLDPDVILVGEIRDADTANIAIQSALTGHLMLSSIHAGDSIGEIFRILDLGVPPFLIASSVIGIVAQRMVRRVCPDCAHLIQAPVVEQKAYEQEVGEQRSEFLYGTGCPSCAHTGYLGRTGMFEILKMSEKIRTMITNRAERSQIRSQAIEEGMIPLITDGMYKVKAGITTPAEVLHSAYAPD